MTVLTNPVLAALRERRSIRKYTDEPLTRDEIETILDAGVWSPSGKNNQPWKFLVLRKGDARVEALSELTKYTAILRGADTLINVFLDKERMYNPLKDHQVAGACMQNMLLAIHSLGLGAVWIGEILGRADEVLAALDLSADRYEFMATLAVGHPAAPGASLRLPLGDFLIEELA